MFKVVFISFIQILLKPPTYVEPFENQTYNILSIYQWINTETNL